MASEDLEMAACQVTGGLMVSEDLETVACWVVPGGLGSSEDLCQKIRVTDSGAKDAGLTLLLMHNW
jgi:hypothetical protein